MNRMHCNNAVQRSTDGDQSRIEKLRTIVESAHLNFLIGAGTPSPYFSALGNIEDTLEELANTETSEHTKELIRASTQAYFFENVLARNIEIIKRDKTAEDVLRSYELFIRTLNRILLRRRSTLLSKQINIFTTNVDMLFEVAMEEVDIDYSDGFNGKIRPKFDLGDFSTLRFRVGSRYEHRFEVPVFNLIKIHGSAAWSVQEQEKRKSAIYFDHGLTFVDKLGELLEEAKPYLLTGEDYLQSKEEGPTIRPIKELVEEAEKRLWKYNILEAVEAFSAKYGELAIVNPDKRKIPEAVEAFSAKYGELGIVNPDKRKFATTVLNETYYELIRRLANELEKENSVLFVHGFSFRDEHLRDIVLRAARTNPTLQVIVFCYSREDRQSYRQLLPDADVKNGNIEFFDPTAPSEGEEERKISLDVLVSDYLTPIVPDSDKQREHDTHSSAGEASGD